MHRARPVALITALVLGTAACADAPDSSGAPPEAARTAGDPGNQEDAGQASSERAVTVAPDPETLC
ncbi:MAG TPA: hypothetical protein VK966_08810, partial [Longimicrobiales bacterium]|nr:hypothetical protein [Longimicrobiales bacterium]